MFNSEDPDEDGCLGWGKAVTNDLAIVTNYAEGAAYDYEAHKMSSYFSGKNEKYLSVDIDAPLERLVTSRNGDVITDVPLKEKGAYDGIYADTLVKMTPSVAAPDVDGTDKIIVWMRESEKGGRTVTNLMITAGYYAGSYDNVERADYEIEEPVIAADTWHRLTVCAISDITGSELVKGNGIPGFVVYIDGVQIVASASYSIGNGYRADWLTPAARVLVGERALFPWLVRYGHDNAMSLSRLSFSGQGAVDDLMFTTTRPNHVEADNTFTLEWDVGVKSMRCIVSTNSVPVSTNEINAAQMPRQWDYRLTSTNVVVTVTNVEYFAENGYSNGVWSAESGCHLVGCSFVCTGTNPVARVASARDCVSVGGATGYETFAEAKARSKTRPIQLELSTNVLVTAFVPGGSYQDTGCFTVTNGDDIVLDLRGHWLQGNGVESTIVHKGGKLRIIDTEGNGAVLPPRGKAVAVQSISKSVAGASMGADASQVLVVEAGRYAGEIKLMADRNSKTYSYCATCIVDGGSYTNFNNGQDFYLQPCVTNTSMYFGLDANEYWAAVTTNAFIWCGMGSNDLWTTAENWQGGEVPAAGDLALFPRITDARTGWPVDFGSGVATKKLWLDADIVMSGTNEFSDVTVMSGTSRLVGTGTATFSLGKLPGRLAADGASEEIRLGSSWRGTVRISNISTAKVLTDISWWGVAGSKVEFAGVRGYLSDKADYPMKYELVLTDAEGAVAWLNETGFTGSTVSFPRLSGTGTFKSPKNLREIAQVFRFEVVEDFTGSFNLGGKRLVLGTGSAAKPSKAGDFTFANGVAVRNVREDGLKVDWAGVNAYFGKSLVVRGNYGKIMAYDKSKTPAVGAVVVTLIMPDGSTNDMCRLEAKDGTISVVSGETVESNGATFMAENLPENVKAGDTFVIPDGSAVMIDGNRVIINGVVVTDFADYYKVVGNGSTYTVAFDKDEATPSLAEVSLVPSEDGAMARIHVDNVKEGLWYGLQTVESLEAGWDSALTEWKRATGDTVTFSTDAIGRASFFRVIMADKDPNGGAK